MNENQSEAGDAADPTPQPALDEDGRERPRFVTDLPDDPQLLRLVAAFERGDFSTVRQDAPKLAASTEDEKVRKAALDLRRRIDPDPLVLTLLGLAALLLAFLIGWSYFGV